MDIPLALPPQRSSFLEDMIKAVFQFIKTVPPGVIRGHHGSTHSSPTSLVMPKLIEFPFEIFIKIVLLGEKPILVERINHLLYRLEVILIVIHDRTIQV